MLTPTSGQVLSDFIQARKQPRNQVATLSGQTNTYIRNLENNEIVNVPKERLIAIGVALNLELSQIDELLFAFDRANLAKDDIPAFINTARNAQLSEAVLPIRDFSLYELILLSMEQPLGHQIIVNDRPTASLMVRGHRSHRDRDILSRHPIYEALNEAIGETRRDNFFSLLSSHRVDHYICRQCLEDYLTCDMDDTERCFRFAHVAALYRTLETAPNFYLYLTRSCANMQFTIKLAGQGRERDKLSYSAKAPHDLYRGERSRLYGFITENPALCECFKDELSQVSRTTLEDLGDKPVQLEYLDNLLSPVKRNLKEKGLI